MSFKVPSIEDLSKKLDQLSGSQKKTFYKEKDDPTFWKPTLDEAGNAEAIIRFLPAHPDEEIPIVRLYTHEFQGPSGYYIENCPTTLNSTAYDTCPCCTANGPLWKTDEATARQRMRKTHFYVNILVVKDKNNPASEGKVFKYKFGKTIFNKINSAMHPKFEDDPKVNPFDPVKGANFRLRIEQQEMKLGNRKQRLPNYDESKFDEPTPIFKEMGKIEMLINQCHLLQPIVAPDKFKSHDELKAKLARALALDTPKVDTPWEEAPARSMPTLPSMDDDLDDDAAKFQALAGED